MAGVIIKEAFDTNWVVPMGPNVNGFEKDLKEFVNRREDNAPLAKSVVGLSAGTAAVHLAERRERHHGALQSRIGI